MSASCSFCSTEVAEISIHSLQLRICPHCYATYFPCGQTMAFRNEISDTSRALWLQALKNKKNVENIPSEIFCIDHHEPLTVGKIPDYNFDGYNTACCKMFHFSCAQTIELLEYTLKNRTPKQERQGKHHFFFIKWLDKFVAKITGNAEPDEDPFDALVYNLHLKKIIE